MLSCVFTSCLTKAKADRMKNIFIMDFFLVVFLVLPQVSFLHTETYFICVYPPLLILCAWLWRLGMFIASDIFENFISFSFRGYLGERICFFFQCFQIALLFRMVRWMSCINVTPETACCQGFSVHYCCYTWCNNRVITRKKTEPQLLTMVCIAPDLGQE